MILIVRVADEIAARLVAESVDLDRSVLNGRMLWMVVGLLLLVLCLNYFVPVFYIFSAVGSYDAGLVIMLSRPRRRVVRIIWEFLFLQDLWRQDTFGYR